MYQIPSNKYWNSWNSQSPAIMEFLPAGFSICPYAYSFSIEKSTGFPFSKAIKLYEHESNGRYCRLQMDHAGTVLELEYFKTDDWTILGHMHVIKNGEWGLRFITMLSFGFDGEGRIECDDGNSHGSMRSYEIAVSLKNNPVCDCYADKNDALAVNMEKLGYYAPTPTPEGSKWYSIAYNLEETPDLYFSVSVANSYKDAKIKADNAILLYTNDETHGSALESLKMSCLNGFTKQTKGKFRSSTDAIRDVMAWNTIADKKNSRVYTSLTRFWTDKKFGGWFVWLDDVFYHSLINAWAGDWVTARNCLKAIMDCNTPAGNLACLMSEYTEWVDRSQPPIFSFIIYKYYLLTHDRELLDEVYPMLLKSHMWWYEKRDGNGNGVLEYGSSQVGHGHFNGTKLAAKDEAAMDNSPMYDSAVFKPESNTINMEDISLNSLLVLDGECLAELAEICNDAENACKLKNDSEKHKDKINQVLWDESREIYANRHWENGFVCPTPTSFYPLAAGIPDNSRADKLINHIFDESEFWTKFPLPSVWLKDESYKDNVYWRGRSWPPLDFITYIGLKRYGKDEEATKLVTRIIENFNDLWEKERHCYENLNPFTGQGSDSVDADPFYGWGALCPLMWVFEHIDIDPWNGFHFGSTTGDTYEIDRVKMGDGVYALSCEPQRTVLKRNGSIIFDADAVGRFRYFVFDSHYASVVVPPQNNNFTVQFPTLLPFRAAVNGENVKASNTIELSRNINNKIELWY